ncbi:MAG: NAD(P)-dependent oxidoreductase [Planctomycetes bacterium]|nr:NAD(P)-dependent oxidoreductase [Planctomycetota bacterium]
MNDNSSFWHGRKVLVTDCTGFLSGAVARELLARGAEVVGLVDDAPAADFFGPENDGRVHLVRGRTDNVFRLHSAMAVHEVGAVFHLAGHEPGADRGTPAVLQAVNLYSRRVPVVAARPLPQLALAHAEDRPDERLGVVRFGEVFGPGDHRLSRTVPATAINLLTGDGAPVPPDGPARDFVFVRDAARACLQAAEAGAGEYAFRSGWLMTDRQMAAAVREAFAGRTAEVPDSAPIVNLLGWRPRQALGAALAETLGWYREFLRAGRAVPVRAAA